MTNFAIGIAGVGAIGALVCATGLAGPAEAQGKVRTYGTVYVGKAVQGMRGYPGYPGVGTLYYEGVKGYSRAGWELGRMQSMRRYGTDPGPWPGLRGAVIGR